ncbi:hypothetical protein JCM11251_000068 [Rhodosporidiobolus azoricus]
MDFGLPEEDAAKLLLPLLGFLMPEELQHKDHLQVLAEGRDGEGVKNCQEQLPPALRLSNLLALPSDVPPTTHIVDSASFIGTNTSLLSLWQTLMQDDGTFKIVAPVQHLSADWKRFGGLQKYGPDNLLLPTSLEHLAWTDWVPPPAEWFVPLRKDIPPGLDNSYYLEQISATGQQYQFQKYQGQPVKVLQKAALKGGPRHGEARERQDCQQEAQVNKNIVLAWQNQILKTLKVPEGHAWYFTPSVAPIDAKPGRRKQGQLPSGKKAVCGTMTVESLNRTGNFLDPTPLIHYLDTALISSTCNPTSPLLPAARSARFIVCYPASDLDPKLQDWSASVSSTKDNANSIWATRTTEMMKHVTT